MVSSITLSLHQGYHFAFSRIVFEKLSDFINIGLFGRVVYLINDVFGALRIVAIDKILF